MKKEQMNIVIVGHVDHGKSTVIGRLLADTNSLPEGKLKQVQDQCARNSKPFEYAFLLDALKDEQTQGITIDSARCFFHTEKRDYIVFDAPGHIEFLKNMVTGAAHAEAALLVIDANEGIQENSRRHGYLLSMLGIKQVSIVVNKMDLVHYSSSVFEEIVKKYTAFLQELDVKPISFIPVSARDGDNIASVSKNMDWYTGRSVLSQLDGFDKQQDRTHLPFRFPVQDVYKFTEDNDDRRIVAGSVECGTVSVGEDVIFLPSYKRSKIKTIEGFNTPVQQEASAGKAVGFTFDEQIYIKPGELMVKVDDAQPLVNTRIRANIFWMSKAPFIKDKTYKLKLGTSRVSVKLAEIKSLIDAAALGVHSHKNQVDRHDVAEVVLEATRPLVFDKVSAVEYTGRFVIVDNYEISGGGIVLDEESAENSLFEQQIREREELWQRGEVHAELRALEYGHPAVFIVLSGRKDTGKIAVASALEKALFSAKQKVYYLGIANVMRGLDSDCLLNRDEHIRRLGELARIITDSGQIFITTVSDLDDYDLEKLKVLNAPNKVIVVNVGENLFNRFKPDLVLKENPKIAQAVKKISELICTSP